MRITTPLGDSATLVVLGTGDIFGELVLLSETALRTVRRLLDVAELYGATRPGTVVHLTQDDLAGLAGTTRPTVNRVLQRAADEGSIALGRQRIEITDPGMLARRAR